MIQKQSWQDAEWVRVFLTEAWPSELDPQNPHQGEDEN